MKWFKHASNSLDDPFIFDLISHFGGDGYLVFFGILEILARESDDDFSKTQPFSVKFLTKKLQLSAKKLTKVLCFIKKNGRFCVEFCGEEILIKCPRLKDLHDEYSRKRKPKISGHSPDNVAQDKDKDKDKEEDIDKETVKEKSSAPEIEIDPALQNQFERICGMSNALVSWLVDCRYPPDWIRAALIATSEAAPSAPVPYCKKILESYAKNGGVTGGRSGGYSGAGGDGEKKLRYTSGAAEREAGKFAGMD